MNRSCREGHRRADQREVWRDVRARMDRLGVESPTGAMGDGYDSRNRDLAEYVAALTPVPGQVGALFSVRGRIVGMELFDSAETYATYQPKLVRSYALDALVEPGAATTQSLPEAEVERALSAVASCPANRYPGLGLGEDLRLENGSLSGGALVHEGRIIHLAAFWTAVGNGNGEFARNRQANRPRDNTETFRTLQSGGAVRINRATLLPPAPAPLRSPDLWDRIEGMLLGLAIGDSLGNTTESLNPRERRLRHGEIRDYLPHRHAGGASVGLPSDDTQLAFWTLDRLNQDGGLNPENLLRDFARRRIFGMGQTVRGSLRRSAQPGQAWHEAGLDSAGNGALMRIAPILVPHVASPSSGLWADAALATLITHNDRAALASSVAFVGMLWKLLSLTRAPEPEWWIETFARSAREVEGDDTRYRTRTPHVRYEGPLTRFAEDQVRSALHRNVATRDACDHWYSGAYLMETVPSLLYILSRHAHDPEEAIVRAVNDTRDNDSIAAMVGAAVGALHGRRALPSRWVDGLLGRTGEDDDGAVFRIIADARRR